MQTIAARDGNTDPVLALLMQQSRVRTGEFRSDNDLVQDDKNLSNSSEKLLSPERTDLAL